MDARVCRLILWIVFLAALSPLSAGWNESFDEETSKLMQEIAPLQALSEYYAAFKKMRSVLVHDQEIFQALKKSDPNKKLRLVQTKFNIILKKRRHNHIHDMYAWELSHLLGGSAFILPSFPIDFDGIKVIAQPLEQFEFGKNAGGGYSKKTLKRVTLETYWKAHLQAYILGMSDLASANIGVNKKGMIRFFDNEACLIYYNCAFRTSMSFSNGFISQSFDWPHYRMPLDKKTAMKVKNFILGFAHFEDHLHKYLQHRPLKILESGLKYRLDQVRNFPVEEGVSFCDFYATLYPQMSPGLDQLNKIAGKIMQRPVDHGSALFFACKRIKHYQLSEEDRAAIQLWIQTYINN